MKNKFLIIGITGPLGSGCTTTADFLSENITKYALENKSKLHETECCIGKYYKYLKKEQNEFLSRKREFDINVSDVLTKPEDISELIDNYYDISMNYEERKKLINRNLRKLLHNRDILNVFCNTIWPKFTVISMSTMMMKLMIENINDVDDEIIKDIVKDSKIIEEMKKLYKNFKLNIENYNNYIDNKMYNKLDNIFCIDIDNFFKELEELKDKLKKIDNGELLQNIGDNLRATGNAFKSYDKEKMNKKFKNLDILSQEANRYIKYTRHRYNDSNNYFVIDSFRNPMEIIYFRERYGSFYVCSVYADAKTRQQRLNIDSNIFFNRDNRDQGKNNALEELYKQNVSACSLMADYAINNENDKNDFYNKLIRYLCLIERPGCTQPTAEETFMNLAYILSLRSTCISRHVGAVITNNEGYIIGAGWNDVGTGQLGCSTRCIKDFNNFATDDSLLSVWKDQYEKFYNEGLIQDYDENDYFCFKDIQSKLIINEKVNDVIDDFDLNSKIKSILSKEENENELNNKYINELIKITNDLKEYLKKNLSIKRLEYARSLHAEENAILQVAINGGMGIKGGTIYVTTFPCELCAKKIYQSGIKRIVYTEPYPNNISENIILKDGIKNIEIQQFEGVKSNSYYRLFKPYFDRKEMQVIDELF